MPTHRPLRDLGRLGSGWIAAGTLLAIGAIWWLGAPGRALANAVPRPSARPVFGGAPRPPRHLRIALATPTSAVTLAEGFKATSGDTDGWPRARIDGPRGVLDVPLAPEHAGIVMRLLGQAPNAADAHLTVRMDGTDVGELTLGQELGLAEVVLPGHLVVAGTNRIELVRHGAPDHAGPSFTTAWFESTSGRVRAEPGRAAPDVDLPEAWTSDDAGGQARRVGTDGSQAFFDLNPLPVDYALLLVGRREGGLDAHVAVSLQLERLGELPLGAAWSSPMLLLRTAALRRGDGSVELTLTQGSSAVLRRVELLPLLEDQLIDVGSPRDRPYLRSGFSGDERAETQTSAWSVGPSSEVVVPLGPTNDSYVLAISARAFAPLAPLSVTASINGHPLGALTLGSTTGIHELPVERTVLIKGGNVVRFAYAATARPVDKDRRSQDTRQLGASFDWLELRPGVTTASPHGARVP